MRSKLRHPIRAIREPFGTAGLIVACVALIAALGGSAIAAKGALTGKQKKEVAKIAKKYAGKPGAPGAAGPAGPQGAAGSNGAAGNDGAPGKDGAQGIQGPKGDKGDKGEKGDPWTVGGVLPPGETLTGAWAYGLTSGPQYMPISFPIPLPAALDKNHVHFINAEEDEVVMNEAEEPEFVAPDNCKGTVGAPSADPGHLCVYAGFTSGALIVSTFISRLDTVKFEPPNTAGASISGARIFTSPTGPGNGWGSFAVTAPAEEEE